VFGRELVQRDGGIAYARREIGPDDLLGLRETDGLVVLADGRLGRRREQGPRQLRGLPEARG
jgi:hypothetical protein